jgi:hypothetical protein
MRSLVIRVSGHEDPREARLPFARLLERIQCLAARHACLQAPPRCAHPAMKPSARPTCARQPGHTNASSSRANAFPDLPNA